MTLLEQINLNAAGIDVGSREHWVAVPADRDPQPVRCFGTFTSDLEALADWLLQCEVKSVAMESTGVYWIPVFQILESRGLEVLLVNARQVSEDASGRRVGDASDCQWLQQLHSYGLLAARVRTRGPGLRVAQLSAASGALGCSKPVLRSRLNAEGADADERSTASRAQRCDRSDRDGDLGCHCGGGTRSVEAGAIEGTRESAAALLETIAKALTGDYRPEQLFVLKQARESYRFLQAQIAECDVEVDTILSGWEAEGGRPTTALAADAQEEPEQIETQAGAF